MVHSAAPLYLPKITLEVMIIPKFFVFFKVVYFLLLINIMTVDMVNNLTWRLKKLLFLKPSGVMTCMTYLNSLNKSSKSMQVASREFYSCILLLGLADGHYSFLAFIDKPATTPGGSTKMIIPWHCSHFIFILLRLVSHLFLFPLFRTICWLSRCLPRLFGYSPFQNHQGTSSRS